MTVLKLLFNGEVKKKNLTFLLTDYARILSHLSHFVNPSIYTAFIYINKLYYIFEYEKVSFFPFFCQTAKIISLPKIQQADILNH